MIKKGACFAQWLALGFAPWAFGTTELWSLFIIQILVGASLTLCAFSSSGDSRGLLRHWRWEVPFLLLCFYFFTQASNPSHHFQSVTQSLLVQRQVAWLPHSVEAHATWVGLAKFLTYGAIFLSMRSCFFEAPADENSLAVRWNPFFTLLAVNGFFLAMVGIMGYVSKTHKLLWWRPSPNGGDFFGPFVNPNHFAAYMNLILLIPLTLGRHAQRSASLHYQRSHPGYLYYLMAALMLVSIFLSRSRAGILLGVSLVVSWLFLEIRRSSRQEISQRTLLVGFGALTLTVLALLAYLGLQPIAHEMATLQNVSEEWKTVNSRGSAYVATLNMFREHWVYGIGLGGFPFAFPYFAPSGMSGFWRYAHNDWLQLLAELGAVGSFLAAATGVGLWQDWCSHQARPSPCLNPESTLQRRLATAMILALVAVGTHALIDFPFHIPAITLTAVVYLALISAFSWQRPRPSRSSPKENPQ